MFELSPVYSEEMEAVEQKAPLTLALIHLVSTAATSEEIKQVPDWLCCVGFHI